MYKVNCFYRWRETNIFKVYYTLLRGTDFLKGWDEIFFLEREKGRDLTKGGGGGFFTFILNFYKKEEHQNDFQFV